MAVITAIFARPNHPKGYGFEPGTAHGYVLWVVGCESREQLEEVTKLLGDSRSKAHHWPGRQGDGWYDGPLDRVCWIEGDVERLVHASGWIQEIVTTEGISIGDNRAVNYENARAIIARAGDAP